LQFLGGFALRWPYVALKSKIALSAERARRRQRASARPFSARYSAAQKNLVFQFFKFPALVFSKSCKNYNFDGAPLFLSGISFFGKTK